MFIRFRPFQLLVECGRAKLYSKVFDRAKLYFVHGFDAESADFCILYDVKHRKSYK